MGKYRFRLSDMMPNAWFYKLKDMSKTSPHNNSNSNSNSSPNPTPNPFKHKKMQPTTTTSSAPSHQQTLQPRKSYYFTREQPPLKPDYLPNSPINPKISDVPFPESPRKSTKRRSSRRRRRNNIKSSSSSSSATATTPTPTPTPTKFVDSSVSAGCSCRATLESVWTTKSDSIPYYSSSPPLPPSDSVSPPPRQCSPDSNRNEATTDVFEGGGRGRPASSWSSSTTTTTTTCSCRISSSSTTDIIMDVDSKRFEKLDEFDMISEIELPPILTKPQKYINKEKKETTQPAMTKPPRRSSSNGGSSSLLLSVKVSKKETKKSNNTLKEQKIKETMMNRRCSSTTTTGSPGGGLKLRANSPKIFASRKIQACSKKTAMSTSKGTHPSTRLMRSRKKNLSDSFAIIKSSFDPQRDFRESMVEMIVENNLRASKDLEELLACYLSLNSNEYHDLIVEVFQQIWFDLTDNMH